MTPEQASLIEQAERLLTGASPHPWAVPIDFGTPWNIDDANGAAVALTAQRRSTAPDTIRNGNTAFIAAAPTLVAALAAELKRALEENADIKSRTGTVLDIIATRLELNPPISKEEQLDIEAVARWVKAIGADHVSALVIERDALRERLAKCEPVVDLMRTADPEPPSHRGRAHGMDRSRVRRHGHDCGSDVARGDAMTLHDYLQSEHARSEMQQASEHGVADAPGRMLSTGTIGAWSVVQVTVDGVSVTAYYRPDGNRYIVTDLGEGYRSAVLRGFDRTKHMAALMGLTKEMPPGFDTDAPLGTIELRDVAAETLPDALCRVMLASLRVAEVTL